MDMGIFDETVPVATEEAYAFQRRLSHEWGNVGPRPAPGDRPEFASTIVAVL